MLFSTITIDDGNSATIAGYCLLETYEFNQKFANPTAERNKLHLQGVSHDMKKFWPHYPIHTIIDSVYLNENGHCIPNITCSLLLRSPLAEKDLRYLIVVYFSRQGRGPVLKKTFW